MTSSLWVSFPVDERSGVPARSRSAAALMAARSAWRSRGRRLIVVLLGWLAGSGAVCGPGLFVAVDDRLDLRCLRGGPVAARVGRERVGGAASQDVEVLALLVDVAVGVGAVRARGAAFGIVGKVVGAQSLVDFGVAT